MGSRRVVVIVVAVIAMTSWLSVCGSGTSASVRSAAPNDGTITVGSFDFAESRLLAEIYSQALEAPGLPRPPCVRSRSRASWSRPRSPTA